MGTNFLYTQVNSALWGWPLIGLLLGAGIYFTIILGGLQFRQLGPALALAFWKRRDSSSVQGEISHFQALMTALASTVGVGNILGVALAISTGGPGAVFWMWMSGIFGMATKYAECLLAVHFRVRDNSGQGAWSGGPMYYIESGLGSRFGGMVFAIFAAIAAFGIGNMSQSNAVADALVRQFGVPEWLSGLVMASVAVVVLFGGIKSVARSASTLVPFMIFIYVGGTVFILFQHGDKILPAFDSIFNAAFNPGAALGGVGGALLKDTIRVGLARGLFSNESGMGSAPIAAAAAASNHPVRQALVAMTQTFIDTLVVCTLTALAILVSIEEAGLAGQSHLTLQAFQGSLGADFGGALLALSIATFAFSTVLGWSYYGEKAAQYVAGPKVVPYYRVIYCAAAFVGAVSPLPLIWTLADIANALMAIPNLIGLLLLSNVVRHLTVDYSRFLSGRESRPLK